MTQEALKSPEYAGKGIELDGEMQADAALDAVVAKKKASDSTGLNGVYQKSFSLVCRYPALF